MYLVAYDTIICFNTMENGTMSVHNIDVNVKIVILIMTVIKTGSFSVYLNIFNNLLINTTMREIKTNNHAMVAMDDIIKYNMNDVFFHESIKAGTAVTPPIINEM